MRLDALTLNDMEQVRQWRNADLAGLRTPYPLTQEMQATFYRDVICNRSAPHRYWAIREPGVHVGTREQPHYQVLAQLIGIGGLTNIQWENGLAEISLLVAPEYRGHGLGVDAVRLLLDEGFGNMGLNTIVGEVYRSNAGAKAFWEKALAGFAVVDWTVLPRRKRWRGRLYHSDYFTMYPLTQEMQATFGVDWAARRP